MDRFQLVNSDGWVNVGDLDPSTVLYHKIGDEEAVYMGRSMPNSKVVAVVDVKGGVRKTTASVHLGHALNRHLGLGARVLIADCDQYHSVQDWSNTAKQLGNPWPETMHVVSCDGTNFHHDIIEAAEEFEPDYVIIDTPPNDEAAARRALLLADAMITPTGPSPLDIRRLAYGLTVGVQAAQQRGRGIQAKALLTGTKMGTNVYNAALTHLQNERLDYFAMPIRDLLAHATAFGTSVKRLNDYAHVPHQLLPMLAAAQKN